MHAGATATATAHALRDCNWSVSHAGGVATGMAAAPDAGFGTGTGEDAGICCERRLGCSAFRGLNLKKGDERGGRTPQRRVEPPIRRLASVRRRYHSNTYKTHDTPPPPTVGGPCRHLPARVQRRPPIGWSGRRHESRRPSTSSDLTSSVQHDLEEHTHTHTHTHTHAHTHIHTHTHMHTHTHTHTHRG